MNNSKCDNWDARFFAATNFFASWSEDSSRKVGAVLVNQESQMVAFGFNGLPRNVDPSPAARHSRENGEKYFWYEHAERNAIYSASLAGISTKSLTMYCNSFPCADCTRAIIQSGISSLKTFNHNETDSVFSRHFEVSMKMLEEANVQLTLYSRNDPLIELVHSHFISAINGENNYFR